MPVEGAADRADLALRTRDAVGQGQRQLQRSADHRPTHRVGEVVDQRALPGVILPHELHAQVEVVARLEEASL